jgi:hypothetical protein
MLPRCFSVSTGRYMFTQSRIYVKSENGCASKLTSHLRLALPNGLFFSFPTIITISISSILLLYANTLLQVFYSATCLTPCLSFNVTHQVSHPHDINKPVKFTSRNIICTFLESRLEEQR